MADTQRPMKIIKLDDGTYAQAIVPIDADGNIVGEGNSTTRLVLTSPNGTKYEVTVDDSGNLSTTAV